MRSSTCGAACWIAGAAALLDWRRSAPRRDSSWTGWQRAANVGPTISRQSASSEAAAKPRRRAAGSSTALSARLRPDAACAVRACLPLSGVATRRRVPSQLHESMHASTAARPPSPAVTLPAAELRRALLAWYDRARRDLPWRARPGERADPYAVLVSEVMLQQTTVATVRPRFAAFMARFPDVATLAAAPLEDVLHEWQGLGYYRRARALHAAARAVVERHGGTLPADLDALRALPGVGAYTAAAVGAIAFGLPAVPVDGNVERGLGRGLALDLALPPRPRAVHAAPAQPGRPGPG